MRVCVCAREMYIGKCEYIVEEKKKESHAPSHTAHGGIVSLNGTTGHFSRYTAFAAVQCVLYNTPHVIRRHRASFVCVYSHLYIYIGIVQHIGTNDF